MTGKSWWSKEAPDAPAQVPKLERLRLARCGALREMTLFAPNLRDLAATDCPSFRAVAIDGGAGMEGELPAMRSAVFGDFRPVEAYHSEHAARRATTPAETAVELVKRCVALETLSVPASATPEDKGDGDVLLSPEDRFVAAWTEPLRDRAVTLARVCVQRPLSVTNLARLVGNVAGDAAASARRALLCGVDGRATRADRGQRGIRCARARHRAVSRARKSHHRGPRPGENERGNHADVVGAVGARVS